MITKKGITLTELMVSVAVMSVGIIGAVGAFKYLNQGIQTAKGKSLANNLAQEKIEVLKNKSYYRVLVTTATEEDTNFSPSFYYDIGPNGVETMNVGGINFERRVYIRKVSEDTSGNLTYRLWNDPDTGLKEILVYVVWQEGSTWKKVEIRSVKEDPDRITVSATFRGNVKQEGTTIDLSSVIVRAQENPARYGETDASGDYSFSIEPGSYTLRASKTGYFPATSSLLPINTGVTFDEDFTLRKMSTGTVTGSVFINDHLVISQVVGSSRNADGFYQEWVEVFNPTTWTWTMATGLNSGVIGIAYQLRNQASPYIIDLDYLTLTVEAEHYYLFANTPTITAVGVTRNADAVYNTDTYTTPDALNIIKINSDPGNDAAGVGLGWAATLQGMDAVGWKTAGQSPEMREGNPIEQETGLQNDESYTRRYKAGSGASGYGRAYDTNDNNDNFLVRLPIYYQPHNSSDTESLRSGTPAGGAIVYADDGLSNSAISDSSGNFTLTNVATGYWTIYASSSMFYLSSGTFGGTSHGFAATASEIYFTSTTVYGYVSGRVSNISDAPLPEIIVSGGGYQAETGSDGKYMLPVIPDTITVIANYLTSTPAYVETSSMGVVVNLGQTTPNVDFTLVQGGKIQGWVTTNGVDPLPNIPVSAFKGGVEQGNSISETDGYFLIWGAGISTGTYEVVPQIEAGETSSPSTHTALVSAGQTVFAGTFTVTGAMGYIEGKVMIGTSVVTGVPITTGVLIYASTTTIDTDPPSINSTLRSGTIAYYAISSNAEGKYSLPVRGGYTYNIYAWYTRWGGDTPSTERRYYTGVAVSAGQTETRNFFW